jgi:hypothetical protein
MAAGGLPQALETGLVRLLAAMRKRSPLIEITGVFLASYAAMYALTCGLLAFGFYKMLEPRQLPNPGMAAYKPPPETVIRYASVTSSSYAQGIGPETRSEDLDPPSEAGRQAAYPTDSAAPPVLLVDTSTAAAMASARTASGATRIHHNPTVRARKAALPRVRSGRAGGGPYFGYAALH